MNEPRRGYRRRDPDLQERLGKAVKFLRTFNSLTQVQLAQTAGISQAALSLVEKGNRIDISNLKRIATALGMPLWQLIEVAENSDDPSKVADATETFLDSFKYSGSIHN